MNEEDEWSALKEYKKGKFNEDRDRFLKQANTDSDGGWTIHSTYHWSRMVAGQRLDYWPSRKKYMYKMKVMRGDVMKFIKNEEANDDSKKPYA